jgi:IS5 family transposase
VTQPLTTINYPPDKAQSQDSGLWDEVRRIFASFEKTAFSQELKVIFENLSDAELIQALEKTRWTGRPGYPIRVMWRTVIVSYVLNVPSTQELIRTLHRNPFISTQCGIYSYQEVPTRFAYYRFVKKLLAHTEVIERCMAQTIEGIRTKIPGFSKVAAVDSTDIPSYCNRYRKPLSDPDAGWGVKQKNDEEFSWPGYKMHLISTVAGNYEIPLLPMVTPANTNDSPMMIPLLKKNKTKIKGFSPVFVLGDKGYDAKENYRSIVEDFKAVPIIDLNLRGRKGKDNRFEDIADEYGTPYCAWGVPMVFWGYDSKQKRLKYRCPLACGKKGCSWIDKCSQSSYGQVVKIQLKDDYRRFTQVPRRTKKWRQLYNMRVSAERIFSRLKSDGDGRLINHRLRGLSKITPNCLLSVWVMQARLSSNLFDNNSESFVDVVG